MRFLDRSHQLGLLGSTETDLYGLYPELQALTVTEPLNMKPGDATVHAIYTVHLNQVTSSMLESAQRSAANAEGL
jgi:hypothetical protein